MASINRIPSFPVRSRFLPAAGMAAIVLMVGTVHGQSVEKPRWGGGAKAGLSYIHDDLCGDTPGITNYADTVAYNRGIVFGTGIIGNSCGSLWKKMDVMIDHGHEIVSHSWTHSDATGGWNAANEIVKSKASVEENTKQKELTYFIFPFDKYNAQNIKDLEAAGYLSARTGKTFYSNDRGITKDMNAFTPFNGTWFHVFFTKDGAQSMINNAEQAIAAGGWAMHEFHGVQDNSWEKISLDEYRKYTDWLKSKVASGDLWVATPTRAVKYIMTHNGSGTPTLAENVLSFPGASGVKAKYNTKISYFVAFPSNPATLTANQGGNFLPVAKKGEKWHVEADPTLGPVFFGLNGAVTLGKPLERMRPLAFERGIDGRGVVSGEIPHGGYRLRVVDAAGQTLGRPIVGFTTTGGISETLDLRRMAAGAYNVRVETAAGVFEGPSLR